MYRIDVEVRIDSFVYLNILVNKRKYTLLRLPYLVPTVVDKSEHGERGKSQDKDTLVDLVKGWLRKE